MDSRYTTHAASWKWPRCPWPDVPRRYGACAALRVLARDLKITSPTLLSVAEIYVGSLFDARRFREQIDYLYGDNHYSNFEDLKHSIMDVLLRLPKEMPVHPGHTDPTTIAEELEENPFVRMWRGLDTPVDRRCTAFGQPATLLLSALDYDGGQKCWVRFDEGNMLDVVPGSQVRVEND